MKLFGGDCRGSLGMFVALGLRMRLVHSFQGRLWCSSHDYLCTTSMSGILLVAYPAMMCPWRLGCFTWDQSTYNHNTTTIQCQCCC